MEKLVNSKLLRQRLSLALSSLVIAASPALGEKKYGPGVTDAEIKIGQTMPYSGPASAYGTIGKVEAAYFEKINGEGGINGRKIRFISLDDSFSPPKTVEQTRRLVEQDGVLLLFQSLGTAPNSAIHKYVNASKVPHVLLATGATKWGDPQNYPWTMGWNPAYQTEARIYARYLLKERPAAKIAILFQNDDFGKDYVKGLKDGLGELAAKMIVAEASYEISDATVDSQLVALKASGADTFFNVTTPKFAAQAIRKVHDMGWRPFQILAQVSGSVGVVLVPAGVEKAVGIISANYFKDPTSPDWRDDLAMKEYLEFMKKHYAEGNLADGANVYGYMVAQLMVHILKQCGDDLTRENVMRQTTNLKSIELSMLYPGIKVNTSPTDYHPVKQMQLMRFDGKEWVRFGELLSR
jgi:branched-chain amino acid transport system substrate-binding protein